MDSDDEDDDQDQKLTDEIAGTLRPHSSKRVKVEGVTPGAGTSSPRRRCASRPASTRRWRSPTLSPPPPASAEATEALPVATFDVSEKEHGVSLGPQVSEQVDESSFALETSSEETPVPGHEWVEVQPNAVLVAVEAGLIPSVDKQHLVDVPREEAEYVDKPDTREPSSGSCLQGEGSNAPVCETPISVKCQNEGSSPSESSSTLSDLGEATSPMLVNDAVTSAPPSSIGQGIPVPSENRGEASSGPPGTGRRTLVPPSVKVVVPVVPPGIRSIPFPLGVAFDPESPQGLLEAARAAFHTNTMHSPQVHYAFYRKSLLFRCRPSSPLSPNPGKHWTKVELEWLAGDRLTSQLLRHDKSDRMLFRRAALQRATFLRTGLVLFNCGCKGAVFLTLYIHRVKISERKSTPRRTYLANAAGFSGGAKPVRPEISNDGCVKTGGRTGFGIQAQLSITQDRTGGADSNVQGSVSYNSFVSELPAATVEYSDEATLPHPDLYPSDSSCTTPQMDLDPDLDPDLGRAFHPQGMTAGFLGDSLGAGSSFSLEQSELLSELGPEPQFTYDKRVDHASPAEPGNGVCFGAQQSAGYMPLAEPHAGADVSQESVHVSAAEPETGPFVARECDNYTFTLEPQASAFASQQSVGYMAPAEPHAGVIVTQEPVHVSAAEPGTGPFVAQECDNYTFLPEPQASTFVPQQSIGYMAPAEPHAGAVVSQESVHVSAAEPETGPFVAHECDNYTFPPEPQASPFNPQQSVDYMAPAEPHAGAVVSQQSVPVSATEPETGPFVAQECDNYTFLPEPQASAFNPQQSVGYMTPAEPHAGAVVSQQSVHVSTTEPETGPFVAQECDNYTFPPEPQASPFVSQQSVGYRAPAEPHTGPFVSQVTISNMSSAASRAGSLVSQSSAAYIFQAAPGQHLVHQGLSYYIKQATVQGPSVEPSSGHDADTTLAIDPALLVAAVAQPSWDPTNLVHSPLIPLSDTQSQLLIQNMSMESSLSGVVSYIGGDMQQPSPIASEFYEDLDAHLDTSSISS